MTATIPVSDPSAFIHAHREAIDEAIARVLDSGWYILGEEVSSFEAEYAEFLGDATVVGVATGTDAIELALRSSGVAPGDGVLVPTNTAVATVAAVERAGAVPVLCDVDPQTANLDARPLDEVIATVEPDVRALVVVHLYGVPADMDALLDVARRHDLLLIEDCAQAHGATYAGRTVGTVGDAAGFSFYPTKNLGAVGDGGAVACRGPATADRARAIRQYGWRERYVSDEPGINSRLDELQAAILRTLLPHLRTANDHRRAIAARYLEGLANADVILPLVPKACEPVWHQFTIRSARRGELVEHLSRRGIGTAVLYPVPIHRQPAYAGRVPTAASLDVAERLAGELLCLPMGLHVDESMADEIVKAVIDHRGS